MKARTWKMWAVVGVVETGESARPYRVKTSHTGAVMISSGHDEVIPVLVTELKPKRRRK